jgi:uncharacterized glyoxalase superfamily protein PhnB
MTTDATDPFDALRLVDAPLAPRSAFTAELRSRLRRELADLLPGAPTAASTVPSSTDTDPEETAMPSPLTPYLAVHDAAAALEFYAEVFGAVETLRFQGDDGRIGHAEITIGTARVMLSDEFPDIGVRSPRTLGGTCVTLHLEVTDVDYSHERAVRSGATSGREPSDQGHGNRTALIEDPFGHRWMLSQPIDADRADAASSTGAGADTTWTVTERRPVEVGYLTMPTNDVAVASAFYGSVFDWQVDAAGGHIGNTKLPMGMAPTEPWGRTTTLYFRVDDLEPYIARVDAAGGKVVERTSSPSGDSVECTDDQGFTFHLWRPSPGY